MQIRSTTILCVRRGNTVVMGGDGQVSLGETVIKNNASKVRFLYNQQVMAGFAGATADALTLFERIEGKLEKHQGNLLRSAIEMSKDWRTDKVLRRLEALLIVADPYTSLLLTGNGDVIEPDDAIIAIGSGGDYAKSAAHALLSHTTLPAEEIVKHSLNIAANVCVYTNTQLVIKKLSTSKSE